MTSAKFLLSTSLEREKSSQAWLTCTECFAGTFLKTFLKTRHAEIIVDLDFIRYLKIVMRISFIWTHNCAVLMTKYFEETIMRSLYLTNLIR